jgi:ATP/maltotriose-dependent transcriptional regulator MalT/DNA-binding SARP family transcriptional activator
MPASASAAGTPPQTAVIQAKVRPPPSPEGEVHRPRVEDALATLIERHRTVVVSATAGAGKTTAVAAALRRLARRVAWLTLDWTDTAPGRLVRYVEAALGGTLPAVSRVASDALSARIPHPEAVGLLVEAVGDAPVVLVVDELDRLGDAAEAWAVLEALTRYAPASMRIVLISRRELPGTMVAQGARMSDVAVVSDETLAFTADEAGAALARLGEPRIDAGAAVAVTGGWVTGVLFEAWRYGEHVAGTGGEADPLHGYLSAHILERLPDADREFLTGNALLDAVTAPRAIALGHLDAAERLASLRAARLPASWEDGGRALRCHPRFREYLLERLERRGADAMRAIRLAHGRLLAAEGQDEEATEALLAAGSPAEALPTAERAIFGVIERLDYAVAQRWLDALSPVAPPGGSPLVMAELLLALAVEDFRRGAALADALAEQRQRAGFAATLPAAALLMALCYAHVGKVDRTWEVFDEVQGEPAAERQVLRYFMTIFSSEEPPPRPELTGGPLDALVLSVDYGYGRLGELLAGESVGWSRAWTQQWMISALSVTGRTQQALELYESVRDHATTSTSLDTVVGPLVLISTGRREEALAALERGRRAARAGGSLVYELLADFSEALLRLRLDRDAGAARAVLDRLERVPLARRLCYLAEQIDALYGLVLLLEGEDDAALERLRHAVRAMCRSDRQLYLPAAAVYLAEAECRTGDEEAADAAADVALGAARRQGSNHMLVRALAEFPAVVSRRLDAEAAADSPWHELGRALLAQGVGLDVPVGATVALREFGGCAILVDSEPVRPRIAKTYELLAYLAARPDARAAREDLLDALFEGRTDKSARAYLRQAVRWMRQVLPEHLVVVEHGEVRLGGDVRIMSESGQFETALAEAARLRGADRLAATLAALAVVDQGDYLPDVTSAWADERRRHLAELATDARYEAAELAFAEGRLDEAGRLVEEVLGAEPYREAAYRLRMRLAAALGDDHGVLRAFQGCERALAAVGAAPTQTTRWLLDQLRR